MPRKKKQDKEWPVIRYNKFRNNWIVDAGTRVSEVDPKTGTKKRDRQYCKTREEAETLAQQLKTKLKNQGIRGFRLSPEQQIDAEKALKIIEPLKVSLTEAVEFYAEYHQSVGSEMTFGDLVDHFRKKLEEDRAKGEGVKDRTLQDYDSRHGKLKSYFGSVPLIMFSYSKDWEPLSRQLGRSSRRYENHLRILFNYAVEKEFIKSTPMKGKLSKAPKLKKPAILNESEWRNLLLSAITTDKKLNLLSFVVLTLYMGLRPESEVPNLTWKNINLKTGKLFIDDDATGKSDLGRTLVIPKCALNLLKICKKKTGPIIKPTNAHRRDWDTLREMAGFIVRNKAGKITKNTWTPDVARHTAGTMVYASTQSKESVKAFLGHTNEVTMRHYINHGEGIDEEAERFFSFTAPLPASADAEAKSA